MIKMNRSLRAFYFLGTTAKINDKKEKSAKDTKKLKLDDEDIKKLQAIGSEDP